MKFGYAYKFDMKIVLPLERKNSIGIPELFSINLIKNTPWHHLGYDMHVIHSRWDHSAVKNVLGGDPVFITIIREPTQQFESMFSYFRFYEYLGYVTLPDFINKLEDNEFEYKLKLEYMRNKKIWGKNQMLFDLGFPVTDFDNELKVKQFVEEVNKNFHLVMIAERFEESIILLKELLCWDYNDLVFLQMNTRHEALKVNLSVGHTEKLRKWLKADSYLYKKLRNVFDEKVERFGQKKMEEEKKKLTLARIKILKKCFPGKKIPENAVYHKMYSYSSHGLINETGSLLPQDMWRISGCRLYGLDKSFSTLNFMDQLKSAQLKMADMNTMQSLENK
ncbi:galactosylceramide sulfotransferase-like isoform X1 [Artemia franciscana]|uniref:galactosylceramide sulfotransferase-like isoform X1 n=1 Tax=Artemia franciscana TaxID=6661 RepID=UPI0032DAA1FB